ncbi:MAG: hypothetical protein L0K77_06835 [Bifidobacterium crudilactis]|uniref:hypothetical protein n=1 Tax=Bifidobacterium crudilactis TaxID=327277 RepID=UPI0026487413|nr:hypothetical protein [Bifidobacterium crudilactis]MDN6587017.1 hypothetical protein [Bifidobacterium crudilactis]
MGDDTMSEQIDVYRAVNSVDADGEPIPGAISLWKSFQAVVAPVTLSDTPDTSSLGVIRGYTVYIRSTEPTGILDSDIICVRGHMLQGDGIVGEMLSRRGVFKGEQLSVRVKAA